MYSGRLIDSITDAVDELTYRSYAYNRQQSPDVSPERWALVFGAEQTAKMERRFQNDFAAALIDRFDTVIAQCNEKGYDA